MKKFYTTLALAAAVAISASAANFSAKKELQVCRPANTESVEFLNATSATLVKKVPVAKVKPSTVADVYGYYSLRVINNMYGSEPDQLSLEIYAGANANEVFIDGFGGSKSIVGVFDPSKCTLSIATHQIVADKVNGVPNYNGPAYFDHVVYTVVDGKVTAVDYPDTPLVATFDDEGNLVFDNPYEGYNCRAGTTSYGLGGGVTLVSERLKAPSNEGWTDCGNATFTDGWFIPELAAVLYDGNPELPPYDVKVFRNDADPNIYRLYDPYAPLNVYFNGDEPETSENYLTVNASLIAGCIELDLTDPDCVLVIPSEYSGLNTTIFGMGMFYMTNEAGEYVYIPTVDTQGMTKQELYDTWKMIAPEFGYQLSTYDKASNLVVIKDAKFTMSGYSGYSTWNAFNAWAFEGDDTFEYMVSKKVDMTSVIQLPDPAGINNIIMDKTNSTLEYFNLQGVRVQNPSNGIYIRRQGNDVQKVYVR